MHQQEARNMAKPIIRYTLAKQIVHFSYNVRNLKDVNKLGSSI